jgi:hypothetical protein
MIRKHGIAASGNALSICHRQHDASRQLVAVGLSEQQAKVCGCAARWVTLAIKSAASRSYGEFEAP